MSEHSVEALTDLDPETASPEDIPLEALREGLQSEDNLTRTHAATLLTPVSVEQPEAVEPLLDLLVDSLDDERTVVVRESLGALSDLADANPDALAGHVGPVVEQLTNEQPLLRFLAARTVDNLQPEHIDLLAPQVGGLLEAATESVESPVEKSDPSDFERQAAYELDAAREREAEIRQYSARIVAARTLAAIAESDVEAVLEYAPQFVDLLESDSGSVTAAAVIVVAEIAEAEPDAVADAVEPLGDVLPDAGETIAAKAITAFGFIGDPAAVEPLRDLAENDERREDLRDLAAETASFLEDQAA